MKACYEVFSNVDVVRLIIELSHVDPWHLCRLAKLGSAFREAVLDSDVVVLNALGRCRVLPKGLSRSAVMGFLTLEWSAVKSLPSKAELLQHCFFTWPSAAKPGVEISKKSISQSNF